MGECTVTRYPCPTGCGGTVEEYDAPSRTVFMAICDTCYWRDPRDYFPVEVIAEEPLDPNDVAWCSGWPGDENRYAYLGPMTPETFAATYPQHFAQRNTAREWHT